MSKVTRSIVRMLGRAATDAIRLRGGQHIEGSIESPPRRQSFSRWVNVRGWAVAKDSDPLTLRVALNGRVVKELQVSLDRPDVVHAGGQNGRVCGFEGTVSLEGLRLPKWSVLTASAVSARDPSVRRTLGVSLLRRTSASARTMPRHAYKETWNAASHTAFDAQCAVAGTDDAQELNRSGESSANDVAQETALGSGDRVLEIGCGVGRVGLKIAPKCKEWVGADVSANMLGHARRALRGLNNVEFVELNGIDLGGLADQSFDVVYCTAVFMHLDEWDRYRYVTEAYRVLREGGRLYFDNFCLSSPDGWKLFQRMAQLDPAARPPHISKSSTGEELETYATMAGFENVRVRRGLILVTVVARKPGSIPQPVLDRPHRQ